MNPKTMEKRQYVVLRLVRCEPPTMRWKVRCLSYALTDMETIRRWWRREAAGWERRVDTAGMELTCLQLRNF